jgi:hypothetical protein
MRWSRFRRRRSDLGACPWCRSAYVVPVDYHAVDEERWWLRLRCGECGNARALTVSNEEAHRYERRLDAGVAVLQRLVDALDHDVSRDRG